MCIIELTRGLVTVVDLVDFKRLGSLRWFASPHGKTCYAARDSSGPRRRRVYLHRAIMSPLPGFDVDHIDGDGLNNKRANLRVVTHRENCLNRHSTTGVSRYLGVALSVDHNWRAYVAKDGIQTYLGTFKTEEQAACARDYYMEERYPGVATLNFPGEKPVSRDEIERMNKARRGRSRFLGVVPRKGNRFEAWLRVGSRKLYLGRFGTELEAAHARDAAVIKHRARLPRAKLNFATEMHHG